MSKTNKKEFQNDPLWSRQHVADYLGVHLTTVRRLGYSGALPMVRVAGAVRVRRSAVEAYVDAQDEGAA